jgi:hypothetical protein
MARNGNEIRMRTQRSIYDKYDIQLMVVDKRLSVLKKVEGVAGSGTRRNTLKQEESIYMKNQGED